ncbi:class I SAM-dependent methyltransferase [Nocardiopsis sp. CNT-189]|uniref:SAM-dependent methyltransferase n=1 Tax=Nocardiopsis oceanisediminis TaxID=2816862 RepID=UPI003B34FDC3
MTEPELPPHHHHLTFNDPLSAEHAARLIRTLGPLAGKRVADLGCGWAELLLRTLESEPAATGTGVDLDERAIAHGRALAEARGLADRVELVAGDAASWAGGPVDVLINLGASHVWGGEPEAHTGNALSAAADLLEPGGRLLFGEGFWQRPPTGAEMAAMPEGLPRGQYRSMADLVDFAMSHGFRLLALSEASRAEWDEFENGHSLRIEEAILAAPGSPGAAELRARADAHREVRLRGFRGLLGLAYLTLVRT